MTRKITICITGCLVAVLFLYAYRASLKTQGPQDLLPVALSPLRTLHGWGYEIKVDGKTFIHQEYIPAVPGKKAFDSREDALLVGNTVLKKLTAGQPPVISVQELNGLGVIKN